MESPRREAADGAGDRKAILKEKLAMLKSLFDDELIEKNEYDKRKAILIDEMLQ